MKNIKEMLRKFKMEESKHVSTPMATGCKLRKDDESLEVDHTMYRSMIGSLLYLTATILNVMQVVVVVSKFQLVPKETHVVAVKEFLDIKKEPWIMDYEIKK